MHNRYLRDDYRGAAPAPSTLTHRAHHTLSPPQPQMTRESGNLRGGFGLGGGFGAPKTTTSAQCPRGRALRVQDGGAPPHSHLLAHEFQILASTRAFRTAR
jgi:hypothetical protein